MNEFITDKQGNTIHFIFPSTLANVDTVINQLKDFLTPLSLPFDLFELIYIIREALNNAVIHGNKRNCELKVEFSFCFMDNHIEIKIIDEGLGFNWQNQLTKSLASPKATSGRGLHTICKYGYSVQFNETGNILYLSK